MQIRTQQGATRSFTVEATTDGKGYILTGTRGATYLAIRFVDSPNLHIMSLGANVNPFPGVVLTDADGELRQANEVVTI